MSRAATVAPLAGAAALPSGERALDNARLGVLLLLLTETMFFCGLISAYLVARAKAGDWPPPGQPRLPELATAFNTLVLLASGSLVWRSCGRLLQGGGASARFGLLGGTLLGALFVLLQGREWARLLAFGLTTSSSLYGAFFYTLIGAHGLHALAGVAALMAAGLRPCWLICARFYWAFVVLLWPFLYVLVYLL